MLINDVGLNVLIIFQIEPTWCLPKKKQTTQPEPFEWPQYV